MNHISHESPILWPKIMRQSKSWRLPAKGYIICCQKHRSHQSKMLDTVFNIRSFGCYSFWGLHPVYYSFNTISSISFINWYYRNFFMETSITLKLLVQIFFQALFSSIKTHTFRLAAVSSTMIVVCSLTSLLFLTIIAIQKINQSFVITVKTIIYLKGFSK